EGTELLSIEGLGCGRDRILLLTDLHRLKEAPQNEEKANQQAPPHDRMQSPDPSFHQEWEPDQYTTESLLHPRQTLPIEGGAKLAELAGIGAPGQKESTVRSPAIRVSGGARETSSQEKESD